VQRTLWIGWQFCLRPLGVSFLQKWPEQRAEARRQRRTQSLAPKPL